MQQQAFSSSPGPQRTHAVVSQGNLVRSARPVVNATRGRAADANSSVASEQQAMEARMAAATGLEQHNQDMDVLARQQEEILISACGRTVSVDSKQASSLLDLQRALQKTLVMEGQLFHFFDVNGTALATDAQVAEALSRGQTPLCATLTDASIHYIENRREELAQMQWKLVRDQMTGATGKIASIARQVSELQNQLETHKHETTKLVERTKNELFRAVETEREVASSENRQLTERVNAVAQLVSAERNKREATNAGIDKSIQSVRDMFDSERASHRQDINMYMSAFQEAKAAVEGEKTSREAFEDRHTFDMHQTNERIDTVSKHFAELLQDQVMAFRRSAEDCNTTLQQQNKLVLHVRSENDQQLAESNARISDFDNRCLALETRSADAASRQASTIERICERHEKVAQGLQTIRLEQAQRTDQIPEVYDKIRALEDLANARDEDTRALMDKEKLIREEQVRRSQLSILQEHTRQLSALEAKVADRLERESMNREENFNQVFEEVGKRTIGKISGDPAATVTIAVAEPGPRVVAQQPLVLLGGTTDSYISNITGVSTVGGSMHVPSGALSPVASSLQPQMQRMTSSPMPSNVSTVSVHSIATAGVPGSIPASSSGSFVSAVHPALMNAVQVMTPQQVGGRHTLGGTPSNRTSIGSAPSRGHSPATQQRGQYAMPLGQQQPTRQVSAGSRLGGRFPS